MHKFNNEDPVEEKPIEVIRDLFTLFGEIIKKENV